LQKILADAGLGSRRRCEEWIEAGRVAINGRTVTRQGVRADPAHDRIEIDGRVLPSPPAKLYFLLNKPRGCVSTLADPEGRPTIRALLPKVRNRIFPIGRLDWDTEGLLILTNDGDLAQRVAHPSTGCPKRYEVKVSGPLPRGAVRALERGFPLDGRPCRPMQVRRRGESVRPVYEVVLLEGRRNQIRRVFAALGRPVQRLRRVAIGPIRDSHLPRGRYRPLTAMEVERLRGATATSSRPRERRS
jgi:pseudouridine synthase